MPGIVWLLLGCLLPLTGFCQPVNSYSIIPKPARIEARDGRFLFTGSTTVRIPAANSELKTIVENFINQLNTASGFAIRIHTTSGTTAADNQLAFVPIDDASLGAEGYRMDCQPNSITIEAAKPAGFFTPYSRCTNFCLPKSSVPRLPRHPLTGRFRPAGSKISRAMGIAVYTSMWRGISSRFRSSKSTST